MTDDRAKAPGIVQKAVNYTKAVVGHVLHGLPVVSWEQQMDRLSLCETCVYLERSDRSCRQCGCPVEDKTLWADQACPLSPPMWGAFP